MTERDGDAPEVPVLPAEVPVPVPDVPAELRLTTAAQVRAAGDPLRSRVLAALRNGPATAKQLATLLGVSPGALGHHLHVLENAGLVRVVARRLVRGIVAKYYARTARLFIYDAGVIARGELDVNLGLISQARDELAEMAGRPADRVMFTAFPHARLTEERAQHYAERLAAVMNDFLAEPWVPDGRLYSMSLAFFESPPSLQAGPKDRRDPHT